MEQATRKQSAVALAPREQRQLDRRQELVRQHRARQVARSKSMLDADLSGTVNNTFTNPDLLRRFHQLNRQFMGCNAFNAPTARREPPSLFAQ